MYGMCLKLSHLGYGHIAPTTLSGKVFLIIYALAGITLARKFNNRNGNINTAFKFDAKIQGSYA